MPQHRRRHIAIAATGAVLALVALRHPSADLKIMTHEARDTAPHRIQAAIDLGLVGVSVLYTWSAPRITG
ncbi:hypothetical protein [Sphingomonas sp. Mn802worker]|uniref:hypothetical protein n=1 Tax=Sphingomonas sp. Mn802worker TaxID=629773 RepID=UPI0003813529|nr:hypothetical protein [Sphingomonas sp. Mn802worker]